MTYARPKILLLYIMGSLSGTLYIGFSGNLHSASSSTNSIITKASPIVTT